MKISFEILSQVSKCQIESLESNNFFVFTLENYNTPKAANINIIVKPENVKESTLNQKEINEQLQEIMERIDSHDLHINKIYEIIRDLLTEKENQKKWDKRELIGFNR